MVEQWNNHGGTVEHLMVEQWNIDTEMGEQWNMWCWNSDEGTVENLMMEQWNKAGGKVDHMLELGLI